MTYLTSLIGRLAKTLGIGAGSTSAPPASASTNDSAPVEQSARRPSTQEKPVASTIGSG